MKIGIAGPVSLEPLKSWLPKDFTLPSVYSFPLIGRLAAGLLTRGHEVTIFAGSEALQETLSLSHGPLSLKITPRRARWAAYDFYAKEVRFLTDAMRASHCDIIHAHWCYEFAAAALDSGLPTLVTAHDNPNEEHLFTRWTRAYPFWFMRCFLGRQILCRASYITAVSPYVKDNIHKITRRHTHVRVIPNGIQQALFAGGRSRLDALPIKRSNFTVASVLEGFGKRKNARAALKGFSLFRSQFPQSLYVLFGGDYQQEGPAHNWARDNGLDAGVLFRGRQSQDVFHPFLLDQVDVLLHPSLLESHPMAIIEAMALGIPVVGGIDSGGVPFTLNHGEAGLLVDVRSPEAIAKALIKVYQDPHTARSFAKKAWIFAKENFTEEIMVDRYLMAYEEVLIGAPS